MSRNEASVDAAVLNWAPESVFTQHDASLDTLSADVWRSWNNSQIQPAAADMWFTPNRVRTSLVDAPAGGSQPTLSELVIEGDLSTLDGKTVAQMFQAELVDMMTNLVISMDQLQRTPDLLNDEQEREFALYMNEHMSETPGMVEAELIKRGAPPSAMEAMKNVLGDFSNAPQLIETGNDDGAQTLVVDNAPYMNTAEAVL